MMKELGSATSKISGGFGQNTDKSMWSADQRYGTTLLRWGNPRAARHSTCRLFFFFACLLAWSCLTDFPEPA